MNNTTLLSLFRFSDFFHQDTLKFWRSPQSSSVEESYDRRTVVSKEERDLGTGHVSKRETYGWLPLVIYPETQSWWLYREGSSCGERFHTNLWHRLSRVPVAKLNSIPYESFFQLQLTDLGHCISSMSKTPFFMDTSTNRFGLGIMINNTYRTKLLQYDQHWELLHQTPMKKCPECHSKRP